MIKELTWDSVFFGRKMGEFTAGSHSPSSLKRALDKAKEDGYRYLRCKLKFQDTPLIKLLESFGFYLTDIGVTLETKNRNFGNSPLEKGDRGGCKAPRVEKADEQPPAPPLLRGNSSVKAAIIKDIPELKRIGRSLFPESRFYSDPFFSKAMADGLYEAWIENSVKGQAADIVFWIPKAGFVTCRRSGKNSGEIVLIGVKKNAKGKGVGSELVGETMKWFEEQQIKIVTVRTQLKNVKALNFYIKLGFLPKEYDIILGKIL